MAARATAVTLALAAGLVCALDWLRRRRARGGARAVKIDGNKIAKEIRAEIKDEVSALEREWEVTPGLAVVLVGARTDSLTYVKHKKKAAAEVGFHSVDVELDERAPQADVLLAIEGLNEDPGRILNTMSELWIPATFRYKLSREGSQDFASKSL